MGHVRIIVAEDDVEMRRCLVEMLESLGAEVRQAASGAELLNLVEWGGPVDLVITDLRMPPPDGLRALAVVRRNYRWVPFLVLTAFADPEIRAAARNLGRATVLDKPFDRDEFLDTVDRMLARPAGEPAPEPG